MGPDEIEAVKNDEEYFRFQPWLAHRLGFTTRAEVAEVNGTHATKLILVCAFGLSPYFPLSHQKNIC
jgi:hypothetical protein